MGDHGGPMPSRRKAPMRYQPAVESRSNFSSEVISLKADSHQDLDLGRPNSLLAPISPPRSSRREARQQDRNPHRQCLRRSTEDSSPPAIKRTKHHHLSNSQSPPCDTHIGLPLPLPAFHSLHNRHLNSRGHLFVIHQHDHPIAGLHYDLRLQFSATSSLSWAVPFGVPGNPNSKRRVRLATETRVHTVNSHLIEGATKSGGSMLVWDAGVYEVLPRRKGEGPERDPGSAEGSQSSGCGEVEKGEEIGDKIGEGEGVSENSKLVEAFGRRKIRIRLHGAKLPKGYTLDMFVGPGSKHLREPRQPMKMKKRRAVKVMETSSEGEEGSDAVIPGADAVAAEWSLEWERREADKMEVRRVNAYAGAENTIGSLYQRKWFICLDREGSGFCRAGKGESWERIKVEGGGLEGFEPFYVRGVEEERSVVTGMKAEDMVRDSGVVGFVRRNGWRAILD